MQKFTSVTIFFSFLDKGFFFTFLFQRKKKFIDTDFAFFFFSKTNFFFFSTVVATVLYNNPTIMGYEISQAVKVQTTTVILRNFAGFENFGAANFFRDFEKFRNPCEIFLFYQYLPCYRN